MATADHRSTAQGNPLAGLIRSGRFEVSVVRKVRKREIATPNSKVHAQMAVSQARSPTSLNAFINEQKPKGVAHPKVLGTGTSLTLRKVVSIIFWYRYYTGYFSMSLQLGSGLRCSFTV